MYIPKVGHIFESPPIEEFGVRLCSNVDEIEVVRQIICVCAKFARKNVGEIDTWSKNFCSFMLAESL